MFTDIGLVFNDSADDGSPVSMPMIDILHYYYSWRSNVVEITMKGNKDIIIRLTNGGGVVSKEVVRINKEEAGIWDYII